MNTDFQSSFNTSTSFFEKLLYKDLFSDLPVSSPLQEDDDTSTVAPESRTTSCKSEFGKNFNPFALFAKADPENAKNKSGFKMYENSKNNSNLAINQLALNEAEKPKKKTLRLKSKISGNLKQKPDEDFEERFQEIIKMEQQP